MWPDPDSELAEVAARVKAEILAQHPARRAAGHLLEHSYMAGLCEPEGVENVHDELRRIAHA